MENGTFRNRINSFKYAIQGIIDLFQSQPNARIHLFVLFFVLIAGSYFQLTTIEWCLITLVSTTVLAAEAANTAIEYLTDLVSPNYNVLAGKAKDAAAASVLFTAIGAAIVGLLIFVPHLYDLLFF